VACVFQIADDVAQLARAANIQFSRRVRQRGRTDFNHHSHIFQFLFSILKSRIKDFFDYTFQYNAFANICQVRKASKRKKNAVKVTERKTFSFLK
jgi:hypothetical protein